MVSNGQREHIALRLSAMEPITFLIQINHRPDGRFDAFCENMPEEIVSGETHEEAAEKAVEVIRERANALAQQESELDESDKDFLSEAFCISQKHKGDPDEWLPMRFDEEGISLGEPFSAPQVVSIQFATSTGSVPNRPSEPTVRELRQLAG